MKGPSLVMVSCVSMGGATLRVPADPDKTLLQTHAAVQLTAARESYNETLPLAKLKPINRLA
jgi:hypothetical protein